MHNFRLFGIPLGYCLLAICALSSSFSLRAQELSLRTTTNVVLVPTLVMDRLGHPVYDLKAEDFVVQDNGVEQNIRMDESFSLDPVSLVVVIDTGQGAATSFDRLSKFGVMIEPIVGDGKGEVAVVTFDSGVKLVHDFTPNTDAVKDYFKSLKPGDSGAAILDAIHYSIHMLEQRPKNNRRVLLLISEAKDHGSTRGVEDILREVEMSNTLIYSSVFSPVMSSLLSKADPPTRNTGNLLALFKVFSAIAEAAKENVPETVARLSGGEYLPFATERGFEDRLIDMGNHVHNLYLLSFQPKNLKTGQHSIRVLVPNGADLVVYSRSGYWAAPTKQP